MLSYVTMLVRDQQALVCFDTQFTAMLLSASSLPEGAGLPVHSLCLFYLAFACFQPCRTETAELISVLGEHL